MGALRGVGCKEAVADRGEGGEALGKEVKIAVAILGGDGHPEDQTGAEGPQEKPEGKKAGN